MIDHDQFDNPNLRALVLKLQAIPEVLQVRFWPILERDLVETYGADSYHFKVCIQKHENDPDVNPRHFILLSQFVMFATYNEPYYHTATVDRFAAMIKYYNEHPDVDKNQLTQLAWQPTVLWEPGHREE